MTNCRIVPRLDIKGPNLVKGIHLEGLRVLGKPSEFAKFYYENGADELIFMDVVASLYGRNSLKNIVAETAKQIFIPLTVGGGVRCLRDISELLQSGADRVAINTAAINDKKFLEEAVKTFGSSTIVLAIEAVKDSKGNYIAFTDNGRQDSGLPAHTWAKEVEDLGAGEILITSVDREGTGKGIDIELVKLIKSTVNIPVLAHGGASDLSQLARTIKETSANGLVIASALHYDLLEKKLLSEPQTEEGNVDFIKSNRKMTSVKTTSITNLKKYFFEHGISCRN